MVSLAYSEAAVEVLDILEHTRKEEVEKVPKKFIEFLKENASKTYIAKLDHTKKIAEMELKPKTKAILGLIYLKCWEDEEGKKTFINRIKENEERFQKEIREKYDIEKVLKNKQSVIQQDGIVEKTELPVIVKKESFIQKIMNKIKGIFRK